ncbi:MAG: hypothetical protein JWM78_3450 [Verrucomicrobiaceae bacterium]|nr:hypothetical protein [Verrucomicrobiaceae bacterium]
MQFDDLKLSPGARMKLVLSGVGGDQASIQSKFIGAYPQHSIIAGVPATAASGALEAGSKVLVSMVTPTDIVTFMTAIEAVAVTPFPHVFLAYPESINVRTVRSAARVNVGVSAQVTNLSADDLVEMHEAQILDMSVSGLRLASKEALGAIGDELALHVQLSFDNIERNIMLAGIIRSLSVSPVRGTPFPQTCGVEFTSMADDKRVVLYAFVFCMIQRFGPQM